MTKKIEWYMIGIATLLTLYGFHLLLGGNSLMNLRNENDFRKNYFCIEYDPGPDHCYTQNQIKRMIEKLAE